MAGAGLEGHSPQLLSRCGPEVPFPSLTRSTSVLDLQLEHQEGLKYKLILKSHRLPNHCQSSSIFQSGLDWSRWLHGQKLCIAIYHTAQPPTFPWHQWLLPQGHFCRFPQNGAFFRSSPGCLHCRNPDGYFSFFTQSGPARLRVSASLRERAGKPLLASGRTEELGGFGCLLDAAELCPKAGGQAGSQG